MATNTVSTGGISGGRSESLGFRLTAGRHESIALSGSTAGHALESEGMVIWRLGLQTRTKWR
jgi:hypothetical protein